MQYSVVHQVLCLISTANKCTKPKFAKAEILIPWDKR